MGFHRAINLKKATKILVGLKEGSNSVRYRLRLCLKETCFQMNRMARIEEQMSACLDKSGFAEDLLSIPGVGVITAARFLGEVGDISSFKSPEQVIKIAGLNLQTNSSGIKKGKTSITTRRRSELRSLLYQVAIVMIDNNTVIEAFYQYY